MSDLPHYDVRHPDYDAWLIRNASHGLNTGQLLRALIDRGARMEHHRTWRSNRCNDPIEYTDALDRQVLAEVITMLEERIGR